MNTINHPAPLRKWSLAITLVMAASVNQASYAEEEKAAPFSMTVISDESHGSKILNGSFETAIDKISKKSERYRQSFSAQTNLCVAYAKAKRLEDAMQACDTAVATLKKREPRVSRASYSDPTLRMEYLANLSIALSNQGVLLAVRGDYDEARSKFLQASNIDVDRSSARENMQRLDTIS